MKKSLYIIVFAVLCSLQCEMGTIGVPVPVAPVSGSVVNVNPPTLIWQNVPGAGMYELQVSADERFNRLVIGTICYLDTSYTPARTMMPGVYSWRVRSKTGG